MAGSPADRPIYVDRNSYGERSELGADHAISRLAEIQHGMVERGQLRGLGLSGDEIDYRLRIGRLHLHHRAVYAVGQRALPREALWMAAVLGGGTRAVLSHRSAAELWRLRDGTSALVDVTAERARRRRPGIRFHRSPLPFDEVTTRDGIPVTTVPRTLLDLAVVLRPRQLERALNEADVLRLWDRLSLVDLLERYPNRAGTAALRVALRQRHAGATVTKSELEEGFLTLVDELGLPRPEVNASLLVDGRTFEPDCLWRQSRLVIELDSRDFHDTIVAFESDRERDRRLAVEGWRTIRVTWRALHQDRAQLARDLRRLLAGATV